MATEAKTYQGIITDADILSEISSIENSDVTPEESEELFSDGIDCLFASKKEKITLGERLGAPGGEGCVYLTSLEGFVAKIYWKKMRTPLREQKINHMIKHPIADASICWPRAILKNNGSFVGMLMPLVDNDVYKKVDPEVGHKNTAKFFADDKRNILKTLISVCSIFEKLKKNKIVMGDVNFNNFLINKNTYEAVLIDLDGAQIDRFPCVTCKEHFNAPELFRDVNTDHGEDDLDEEHIANAFYHRFYSTFYRDNFSLAVYSFMLLIGVKPYNDITDLKFRCLGYDLTDKTKTLTKKSKFFSYRWAHLPFFVRQALHDSLRAEKGKDRLTPTQWKRIFEYYLELLEMDRLSELDPQCLVPYALSEIEYNVLEGIKMLQAITIPAVAFSLSDALKKVLNTLKEQGAPVSFNVNHVANELNKKRVITLEKSLKIKLNLNIGVLKKITAEYKVG